MNNDPIISNSAMNSRIIVHKRRLRAYVAGALIFGLISITGFLWLLTPDNISAANTSTPRKVQPNASKPATAGGIATGNTAKAQPVSVKEITTVPNCVPAAYPISGVPAVNQLGNGLVDTGTKTTQYTVFGNTTSQISNQIRACSPVLLGGNRFAASTDYVINWAFQYQTTENGLCKITNANVGINIAKILPSWQPSNGATVGTQNAWNSFISNLDNHEEGHVRLDRQYANQILSMLQNYPETSCETIQVAANDRANALISQLDQANKLYDQTTGHGTTQGASL